MRPGDALGNLFMPPLIWLASSAALLVGLGAGRALGIGRCHRDDAGDWKTRMAARDNDLQKAQEDLADITISLQEAEARLAGQTGMPGDLDLSNPDPGAAEAEVARERARADALAERLSAAEADLASLGRPDSDTGAAAGSELADRIEELEVELASLSSHKCPDPAAHRDGANDASGRMADQSPSGTSPDG